MLSRILCIAFLLSLAACGGGDSSDSTANTTVSVDGIWTGTFTSNVSQNSYDLVGLIENQRLIFVSFSAGTLYEGSVSTDNNNFTANLTAYEQGGGRFANTTVTGTFAESSTLNGSYTSSNGDSGTISLHFESLYNRSSSFSLLQGTWSHTDATGTTTISVDGDGNVSGADSAGCMYSGLIEIIDANHHIYDLTLNVSACSVYNGQYAGFVFLDDTVTTNDTLAYAVSNADYISIGELFRQ